MPERFEPTYRWPQDYVPLDGGRVLVRPDCVAGFRELGWTSINDVMKASNVQIVRKLRARDNCTVEVRTDNGIARGYLKRHRVRSVRRWFLESGRRRASSSPGMAEAGAVGWCQEAGVPTVSIIAAGETSGTRSWQSDSFFISENLQGCMPANNHWFKFEQRHAPPDGFASDVQTRRAVLKAVADTAKRFHAAHLSHFDFYLDHFFVTDEPEPTAFLLDLQRVERHSHVATRWRAFNKDLGQFLASCERYRFSEAERSEWLSNYLDIEDGDMNAVHSLRLKMATGRLQIRRFRRKFQKRGRRAA
ncbi:MAG: lipopolysaccharide kinase InaA family protein [Planctomycetaceae bacterium]